jgi:hypothetical protein
VIRFLRAMLGLFIGWSVGVALGLLVIFADLPLPHSLRGPALLLCLGLPLIAGPTIAVMWPSQTKDHA